MPHVDDINDPVLAGLAQEHEDAMGTGWKRGFPPGAPYPGMEDDFEVRFAPAGAVWHKRREQTGGRVQGQRYRAVPEQEV